MLGLLRVVNRPLNVCVAQITRSVASGSYAVDRAKYQNQLTDMRRSWLEEFARKKELKAEKDKEERQLTIEKRAMRMRERRNLSKVRQAEHHKWMEADQLRKKTYTAKNHVKFEQKVVKQNERYRRVAEDLSLESQSWITADDYKTRINADLFSDEPSTTGIVTKYSNHWRYQVQSANYQLEQALRPQNFVSNKTPEEKEEHRIAEHRFHHRQSMEEFLSSMVGSGEELLKLKDLVDDMVGDTIVNQGGMKDEWQQYHELYDRMNEMVMDIAHQQSEDFTGEEDPELQDFIPSVVPLADEGKDDLWEYQGTRHSIVTYPDDINDSNFEKEIKSLAEVVFQKREAALLAGHKSFVHEDRTIEITPEDIAEYEQRSRLSAKFTALENKQDSFTWRGEKHVFTEEEKAKFVEIQEEEREEAKNYALSYGESTYEFNGEEHQIDPEEVETARAVLATKEKALAAGESSYTFEGETTELTEDDHAEYYEVASHRVKQAALALGADSYEFGGETFLFSAEEKAIFAEEEKWVNDRLAHLEAKFTQEVETMVKNKYLTAAEAKVELEKMVAGREGFKQQLREELEKRNEEYFTKKMLEEYGEEEEEED